MFQLKRQFYNASEPELSPMGLELERLKHLRAGILRGAKILEVELERVTKKLIDLEDRLDDSTKAIGVMSHMFREDWSGQYCRRTSEKWEEEFYNCDNDEDAESPSVQPTITTSRDNASSSAKASGGRHQNPKNSPPVLPSSPDVVVARPIKPLPSRALTAERRRLPHIRLTAASRGGPPAVPSGSKLQSAKVASAKVALSEVPEEFKQIFVDF